MVLITMQMTTINNIIDDAIGAAKNKEALYNEFKANQSFEALEEAIKKLD